MDNTSCRICPRNCRADRASARGFCQSGTEPKLARAALHLWEEPCISGSRGSGTVFFSGCSLRCVFCQNDKISRGNYGKTVSVSRLREIYQELIDLGAHNINLVNPTHWAEPVLQSLEDRLPVPVVYNTGGYEEVSTLRRFEGRVQIYLPDMKYADASLAARLSAAPDYPEKAKAAIEEMVRQTGPYELDDDGLLLRGTIIRHLILPGHLENTRQVLDWVDQTFLPGEVLFSLMSQYTPCGDLSAFPELQRRLTREEYDACASYLAQTGIEDGFFQELSSAEEEYIPPFDCQGV
ncbi:MAG: 4Fe-4S cluster-binding domain-containing protein [Oscillospiraceae bacterium]|nr:4Fe-4S cluster-binding domain-containing protein [Oscillospiraceae bacterium]